MVMSLNICYEPSLKFKLLNEWLLHYYGDLRKNPPANINFSKEEWGGKEWTLDHLVKEALRHIQNA
jgi:hypothetical protein